MSKIYVCPLAHVARMVDDTGARSLVTLITANATTPTVVVRPPAIASEHHLHIAVSDIVTEVDGHVLPQDGHVAALLAFVQRWDRAAPLLIHCWAGVSRSTAAAYITACALNPARDEQELAQALRRASPTATPNPRLVALADAKLGRQGRMVAAIAAIGRGEDCFEGVPFALDLMPPDLMAASD